MRNVLCLTLSLIAMGTLRSYGETSVAIDVNSIEKSTPAFRFERVPAPSATDAGNLATFSVSTRSGSAKHTPVELLHDGRVATNRDDPRHSFFFSSGGGRVLIDLGRTIDIQQVNSYSWHPNTRAAQVYTLWGAPSEIKNVERASDSQVDMSNTGWNRLARVDTRTEVDNQTGGQVGVSIANDSQHTLGSYRYMLMEIEPTESKGRFNDTFYCELDIVDGKEHPLPKLKHVDTLTINEKYEITFNTIAAPELRGWVDERLKPVCRDWYPKIVEMLPSDGFEAPQKFTIFFRNNLDGVAYTSGTQVHCSGVWFRRNLEGEAAGAVVHELVHVVQQYRSRRNPSWLIEGVCDYIRWFLYEPKRLRPKIDFRRSNYDNSYRVTGAFLNFVVSQHGEQVVPKLNAAMREDQYNDDLWKEITGKSAPGLWADFAKSEQQE